MDENVNFLIEQGKIKEAIEVLEREISGRGCEENLLLLGELYYKEGKSIEALNKFNAVLQVNPENVKAAAYVIMINDVLDFYHKDLLNP